MFIDKEFRKAKVLWKSISSDKRPKNLELSKIYALCKKYCLRLQEEKDLNTSTIGLDDLKMIAQERLQWLAKQLDGKEFICGDRFTLADIMLYCFLNFGASVGQAISEENKNISNLYSRLSELDSASA